MEMQTIQTASSSPSAWQSEALVEDTHATVKPRKMLMLADVESQRKAQLLDGKLNPTVTEVSSSRPQLTKSAVSMGAEATLQLLSDIEDVQGQIEFDVDFFKDALKAGVLDMSEPSALNGEICKGQEFLDGLVDAMDSNPDEYGQFQAMGGAIKTFRTSPNEDNYGALLTAVIVDLIKMKTTTIQSLINTVRLNIGFSFERTEFQAKQIIDQGVMTMIGGAVQAAATIAMAGAGYLVQREGFAKRDEAFNLQNKIDKAKPKLNDLMKQEQKLDTELQQRYYSRHPDKQRVIEQYREYDSQLATNARMEKHLEGRLKSKFNERQIVDEDGSVSVITDLGPQFEDQKFLRRLRDETSQMKLAQQSLKNEYGEFSIYSTDDLHDMLRDVRVGPKGIKHYEDKIKLAETQKYDLDRVANDKQNLGFAIVNATGIAQLGQMAMGSITKAAEAGSTIEGTHASNFEKIVQMLLQAFQNALSQLDGNISLITEILRSRNEANSAIVSNSKVSG